MSLAPFVVLSAHLPLWSAVIALHYEVAMRLGVNTEMGPALHKTFRDAGLPTPSMRLEMELGRDADFTRNISDATISILPQIEKLNLPIEKLGDPGDAAAASSRRSGRFEPSRAAASTCWSVGRTRAS
jgi:hypothetical protein